MELAKKYGKGKYGERGMYYIIARKEPELLNTAIRAHLEAGDLFLWDSRTIHCGVESKRNRENSKDRAVIYTCYTPRSLATEAALKKNRKAFDEMRTTNHWPHKPKLFPLKPRTYGKELVPTTSIEPPKVNSLGLKLAGF